MTKVKIDRSFYNEVNAIVSAIEHENFLIGQRTNWLVMGKHFCSQLLHRSPSKVTCTSSRGVSSSCAS